MLPCCEAGSFEKLVDKAAAGTENKGTVCLLAVGGLTLYKIKLKIFTKCLKMLQEIFRSNANNSSFLYGLQSYCYHLLNYNMKHSLV